MLVGGLVKSWTDFVGKDNDSAADKLSHVATVAMLIVFAIFVTTTTYISASAIACWCPAEFSGSWVSYTKSVCWVDNTYYIPLDDTIPTDINERGDAELMYYQWVPVIFIFMALLFKIPNIVWNALDDGVGMNFDKVVKLAKDTQIGKDREKTINFISKYMFRWLIINQDYSKGRRAMVRQRVTQLCAFACSRKQGNYLIGCYMFSKILYMANIIGQFFLLNSFLAMDYSLYGAEVISHLIDHGDLKQSIRFPRVTLCDFEIRQLQNILRYTVQCVLPINLFNEKIFVFLWFWLVILAIVTGVDIIFWLYRIAVRRNRAKFAVDHLNFFEFEKGGETRKLYRTFANDFLRDDGIFVLRIIGKNSTDIVVADVVGLLWLKYCKRKGLEFKDDMIKYLLKQGLIQKVQNNDIGKDDDMIMELEEPKLIDNKTSGNLLWKWYSQKIGVKDMDKKKPDKEKSDDKKVEDEKEVGSGDNPGDDNTLYPNLPENQPTQRLKQ